MFSNVSPAQQYWLNVLGHHHHPVETACAPDLPSRRGAIRFTNIVANNNVIMDGVTYTFVNSLTTPAAGNAQILLQGSVADNVKLLAKATQGEANANIAYASGQGINTYMIAYWTSTRFSVGATIIPAGNNLFVLERIEDSNTAYTFSTTATATLTALTRAAAFRYTLNGNTTPVTNNVTGDLHCVLPINSIVLGGQNSGVLTRVMYDVHDVCVTDQTDTSEKELDLYISNDEVTFTRIARSLPIGGDTAQVSLHNHIALMCQRIQSGYGYYVRCRSTGNAPTDTIDLKISYHLYPAELSL